MPFNFPEADEIKFVNGRLWVGYFCPKCTKSKEWKEYGIRCMNRDKLDVELPDIRKQPWCWPCRLRKWKCVDPSQSRLFDDTDMPPDDFPDGFNAEDD